MTRPDCLACCFFREVGLQSGYSRRLCAFTGDKKPEAGMYGCRFIPGKWSQLDAILGLPMAGVCGNSGDPNNTKPGNGLQNVTMIAIDDFRNIPINHITAERLKRRFYSSSTREGWQRVAGETVKSPFFAFNPPTTRGTHV